MTQTIQLNSTQWQMIDLQAPTTILANAGGVWISEQQNGANALSNMGQFTLDAGTYYMRAQNPSGISISLTDKIITGAAAAAVPPVINNNNNIDMTGIRLPIQNNINVPPAQPIVQNNVQAAPAAVTIEVTRVMQDIIDAMAMSAALFVSIPQGQQPSTQNIPAGKYGLRIV